MTPAPNTERGRCGGEIVSACRRVLTRQWSVRETRSGGCPKPPPMNSTPKLWPKLDMYLEHGTSLAILVGADGRAEI